MGRSTGQINKNIQNQKIEREVNKNMYSEEKSLQPSHLINSNSKKQWMGNHEKSTKKLNRVNIGRLHDNLKRTGEKNKNNRSNPYNTQSKFTQKQTKTKKVEKEKQKIMKSSEENPTYNYSSKMAIV